MNSVGERPHLATAHRLRLERAELELVVEMAGVGQDRAVRISGKWATPKTLRLPVALMKMSPSAAAASASHDAEAVHRRLERADRVDLDHDHVGAHAAARMAIPRPTQP